MPHHHRILGALDRFQEGCIGVLLGLTIPLGLGLLFGPSWLWFMALGSTLTLGVLLWYVHGLQLAIRAEIGAED